MLVRNIPPTTLATLAFCLPDNLKHSGACTPLNPYCGGDPASRLLNWKFTVTTFCNSGHVDSAWWEATRNQFGAVHC
ncbi:hypothetical protein COCMIDRAFT_83713 [Bipolaris oryzae ATCC 44560]|uniref:Uncharacterized protein n=1 Tax=Bipolaris oryzae ATCC 44560 TaxID=930090 RepID=W6ZIP9_COCMI|nr:uncharacterized protein COCMIDRAFT_83713 [Bipolaris oryzae ATCC 44560]EUC49870.1 hypothetical protein COCMIDRAFT_83713 [Bipolaris oryzae ATCC 44560]